MPQFQYLVLSKAAWPVPHESILFSSSNCSQTEPLVQSMSGLHLPFFPLSEKLTLPYARKLESKCDFGDGDGAVCRTPKTISQNSGSNWVTAIAFRTILHNIIGEHRNHEAPQYILDQMSSRRNERFTLSIVALIYRAFALKGVKKSK